ncbi:hypothetical protein [Streptomyces sp. G45]|uniref:hypothetical protein n=1 Tax=Streptomyces sp. G45 TaxID=3406627 RepID=UPI003C1912C8
MNALNSANALNTVERPHRTPEASPQPKARPAPQPAVPARNFASTSVPRHLARGALGFGLLIGSIGLVPTVGPAALLAAPLALIAFRGCPTCWLVGLAQTVSRGRLERQCADNVCTLAKAHPAADSVTGPTADLTTPTAPR